MLSKHVEHNRWPFLFQNVFVDLSISFLQIKHLNIGTIELLISKNGFLQIILSLKFKTIKLSQKLSILLKKSKL